MTTSNEITVDLIKSFLTIEEKVKELDIFPTATGGTGINNLKEFPLPEPAFPSVRRKGTEYIQKYLQKKKPQILRQPSIELPCGSTVSICTLDDVEGLSTVAGDLPTVNELDSETIQQIYASYYNDSHTYDPDLTITSYKDEIMRQLNINSVVIIQGPTGCGKTTQVPQYILDYHADRGKHCNIIVTQPRKIAAISIARRVCYERGWPVGSLVGYQVAMDPQVSADTRLTYVTTGVLLEKLVNAKTMDMYTHVIIDEVHERDQYIDFALLLVKKFLISNSPRVKVILMSATFDSSLFAQYFSDCSSTSEHAPIIEVQGKSKEVTVHYVNELATLMTKAPNFDLASPGIDPYLYEAVIKLMYIFDRIEKTEQQIPASDEYAPARGAVLIFLPGYDEISALSDKLHEARFNKKFWVLPLHSSITVEEQVKVFKDPPPNHRKVILATNIAESSITVPDVKYVIDFCLTRNLITDPMTNYTCLQLEWASKSNCIQRKGRAGRVDIGKVYRMIPESFYELLPEYGTPEIKRCPLTRTILQLKKLDLCSPEEMLAYALDPPLESDIENAVLTLKEALALTGLKNDAKNGDLTFIGQVMASLPLDVKLSKLIIFGYAFDCLEDCIIIAASLSLQSFFARPFQKALDAYRSRLAWADDSFSDCLAYLNAYKTWKQLTTRGAFRRNIQDREWCEANFIQFKRIKEVEQLIKETKSRLEKQNIVITPRQQANRDQLNQLHPEILLKILMAGAFYPHYYLQEELDEQIIKREINEADPTCTVVIRNLPQNHGLLYACALRDMVSCCGRNIDIEFEEKKAYIRFEKNPGSPPSKVILPVYLALKMRYLRMPLELTVFSPEDAEKKLKEMRQLKHSTSETRLISNRCTVATSQPSLKRYTLPELSTAMIKIFIMHVDNCGLFWARYTTSEVITHLHFLHTTLNGNQRLKPLQKKPEENMLCVAPYEDGPHSAYYRAQIKKKIDYNKVKVFFVDFGNEETVLVRALREIDGDAQEIFNTPALAFQCHLSEVAPNDPSGTWSQKANAFFKSEVNGHAVKARIYSVVQDTLRVELLKIGRDGAIININELLIQKGFAVKVEESFVSKQNHEYRMKSSDYNTNDSFTNTLEFSLEDAEEFSDVKKSTRKHYLHGPFNPLEVSYVGLTNLDRIKCVKVERDSVNSVSFNDEFQEPCRTMLIASTVSIGQKSENLCIRNTTLMPRILSLPSLICLIFSPVVEIRASKEQTEYIGALCGLGFDPETGTSIYADHDIEIAFDAKIDVDDISAINEIRLMFNLSLDDKNRTSSTRHYMQEKLGDKILSLLRKHRVAKTPELSQKGCRWSPTSGEMLQPVTEAADIQTTVLPFIQVPLLRKPELRKNIADLYEIINQRNINSTFYRTRCELCAETFDTTRDLAVHLNKESHIVREEELGPS